MQMEGSRHVDHRVPVGEDKDRRGTHFRGNGETDFFQFRGKLNLTPFFVSMAVIGTYGSN